MSYALAVKEDYVRGGFELPKAAQDCRAFPEGQEAGNIWEGGLENGGLLLNWFKSWEGKYADRCAAHITLKRDVAAGYGLRGDLEGPIPSGILGVIRPWLLAWPNEGKFLGQS